MLAPQIDSLPPDARFDAFRDAPPWPGLRDDLRQRCAERADEVDDVTALLLDHVDESAGPPARRVAAAHIIAVACLGDNHLWQDLLLSSRGELNRFLRHWFPALVAKNTSDMKWKKFFYRQLCERADIPICRSPSCAACRDYAMCFETGADDQ